MVVRRALSCARPSATVVLVLAAAPVTRRCTWAFSAIPLLTQSLSPSAASSPSTLMRTPTPRCPSSGSSVIAAQDTQYFTTHFRGYVNAVRDLPIIARIASELRNHGPQWIADTLAGLSLPPETELAPRIIPNAMPEVWEAMCKSNFGKFNFEDSIYAILAQCGGHDGYVRVPDSLQFNSIERLRRTERTLVPFFARWGYTSPARSSASTPCTPRRSPTTVR